MTIVPLTMALRSNKSKFGFEGDSALVNCYIEEIGPEGVFPHVAYAMPGLALFAALASGGRIRAWLAIGAKLYVVADRTVYVVDASGSASIIGGFPTDGPAYMGYNRREPAQIGIVSAGLYKVIDTGTDTLQDINIPGLDPPQSFAVVDGYGLLPGPGDKWHITSADDFTQVDLLDFASAESDPDEIVRVIEHNNEAWLLGARTTEPWSNTGGSFPFTRTHRFDQGCLAAGTAAIVNDRLMCVLDDKTVGMANGYRFQRVSNHGVERAIEAEPNKADMTATTFTFQGHHFYVLNGTNFSYQYDTTTGSWSERQSYGLDRWRIDTVTEFNGGLIAGDYANGKLYTMSADHKDEAGQPIVMSMIPPPVHALPHKLNMSNLQVHAVPGVGLNTTNAANIDPKMMIRYSDDGGQTWRGEKHRSLGKLGETQTRVKVNRLAQLKRNSRLFEFSISADVDRGIMGATMDVEALAA
jgi:hypothetical protein